MKRRQNLLWCSIVAGFLILGAACSNPSSDDSGGSAAGDTQAPTVESVITSSGTSGTATTVSWGAATDDVTTAADLQYKLVQATASASIDTVSKANAVTAVMDWTANTLTASVSGLSAGTTYYFAVLVQDAAGNMSLYAPVSVTTSTAADTTAPTVGSNIAFSSTTSSGTTVSWEAATDNVTTTANLQYKLVQATSSTAIDTVSEASAITTSSAGLVMTWTAATLTSTVTGLADNRPYYFAVLVRDGAGNMSLYTPASVTTSASSSLLDEYRFENNANDSVGSYNLTFSGTSSYSTSSKKEGFYSVYLNGSTYYTNDSTSISVSSGTTVSAWFYLDSSANLSNGPTILTLFNGSYCYTFYTYGTDLWVADSNGEKELSSATISSDTWYHLVATIDTNANLICYLNGSTVQSLSLADYFSSFEKIHIGGYSGNYLWKGYIDDVRIYNKVLSATEISALYASY